MYIMVSGAAEVDVGGRFHRLERGDFFGEMAVLAGKPREATVKALRTLREVADITTGRRTITLRDPELLRPHARLD
jgi:CRP-like cAMP-binding protein